VVLHENSSFYKMEAMPPGKARGLTLIPSRIRRTCLMATQQATLTPIEPLVSVSSYRSVAIHRDFAVVGDPWRQTSFGEDAGAVYVFRRVGEGWAQEAELSGWDITPYDHFGAAVAVSDDMLVVGAPGHDHSRGAVFYYPRSGGTWIEQGYLERPGVPGYGFGAVVAMDGEVLLVPADVDSGPNVVFAYRRDGLNWFSNGSMQGDYDDYRRSDGGFGSSVAVSAATGLAIVGAPSQGDLRHGSAYVFHDYGDGAWRRVVQLKGREDELQSPPGFGESVAISGLRAMVGSPGDAASGAAVGAVYVFEANSGGWAGVQLLRASDPAAFDNFGYSVALTSTTALVGARPDDGLHWPAYVFERVPATGNWIESVKVSTPVPDPGREFHLALGGEAFATSLPSTSTNEAASVYRKSAGTWSKEATLVPREGSRFDGFGSSVSIDGDVLAVGAKGDDPGNAENSGAVYIYQSASAAWTQQARLTAPTPTPWEQVGFAVGLSGDALVVGCPPQLNFAPPTATGHVYVFRRSGAGWTVEATLLPSGSALKKFGVAVAISGDTAVVGGPDADTVRGTRTGAAFVFVRQNGQWIQQAELVGSEGSSGDLSGSAVAIERDTIAMGSPGDGPGCGAVYVFTRSGASWTEQAVLRATTAKPNDRLGASVAISGDRLVAGAPGRPFSRVPGYASVFAYTASGWSEQARLSPPSAQTAGRFGTAVAVTEHGRVLAGDPNIRKAYVFASVDGSWQQQDVLDGVLAGSFGSSISATGDAAVIGAPSAATPIGLSGAALVFSLT